MLEVETGTWRVQNRTLLTGAADVVQAVSVPWYSSRESYPLDNYRWLINHGYSATTRYLASRQEIKVTNGANYHVQRTHRTTGARSIFNYDGYPNYGISNIAPLDNSFFSTYDNIALGSISKKLLKAQRVLSGGTALGELREAIHMIRHPLKGLRTGWHDYLALLKRRGRQLEHVGRGHKYRRGDGYSRLLQRVVSETWLEASFGWKPLVADLDNGLEAIADIQYRSYPPRRIDSALIPFSFLNGKQTLGAFSTSRDGVLTFEQALSWRGFVKYKVCTTMRTDGEPGALDRLGLTLNNFVPTVWELLPFSFLVDYVFNVGEILDAVSMGNIAPNWGVYTRKYECNVLNIFKYSLTKDPLWVYDPVTSINPLVKIRYEYTDRRIANGPYVPGLRFTADLSWKKYANLAALTSIFSSTSEDFLRLARRGR
jgi:hypothetical protein